MTLNCVFSFLKVSSLHLHNLMAFYQTNRTDKCMASLERRNSCERTNERMLCFQIRSTLHGSSVLHHLIVWQLDKRHLQNFIHGNCMSGHAIVYFKMLHRTVDTILTVHSSSLHSLTTLKIVDQLCFLINNLITMSKKS